MKQTSDVQQQLPECVSCSKVGALTAFCPQCEGMICGDCINNHKTMRTLKRTHQATLLSEFKRQNVNSYINYKSLCKERFHEECRLEYYCKTCRKCVCHKCAATTHSSHDKVSIEKATKDGKKLIGREKQHLDELLVKYKRDLAWCNENVRNFKSEVDTGKDKVRCHTRAMIKILQERENVAIAELDRKLEQRLKEHEEEKRDVNANIHQISELTYQCEAMANEQLDHYVLDGYENLQAVCKSMMEDKPSISSGRANLYSSVYYSPNPEVIPLMQNLEFGEVVETVTDPSRCSIESLSNARCGFMNEFRIVTRNSEGNVCHTNTGLINIKIQDCDGEIVKKELVETQTGTFVVRYKAEEVSPYKVAVNICGKQIRNSPQNVETIDGKAELKPLMLVDLKEMTEPFRLAASDRGDIAVINHPISKDSRVNLFNAVGEYLRQFGGKEAGKDQLHFSSAVLFNKDRILISENPDRQYSILKEFGVDGTYKKTICALPTGVLVVAMCTVNQNIACLCYNKNNRESFIKILNKHNFDHLRDFKLDVPNDGLWVPRFLAYGKYNKIFVEFLDKNSVYVFDKDGCLLNTFGDKGKNNGQFNGLRGLAVFGEEVILTCDLNNHRVQVFNQDGQFIRCFGSRGSSLGQMNGPVAICVSPDGRVFVLEFDGKRVQIFK